jgi:hypothetical protein
LRLTPSAAAASGAFKYLERLGLSIMSTLYQQ